MCFVGGLIISFLGAILLITGSGDAFAALFGFGAIISLVGTGFLMCVRSRPTFTLPRLLTNSGFWRQAKLMFKPVRAAAAIVMLLAIVMCFVAAFLLPPALCILFVIIEYCAMAWYSLSYIPYARDVSCAKDWESDNRRQSRASYHGSSRQQTALVKMIQRC